MGGICGSSLGSPSFVAVDDKPCGITNGPEKPSYHSPLLEAAAGAAASSPVTWRG